MDELTSLLGSLAVGEFSDPDYFYYVYGNRYSVPIELINKYAEVIFNQVSFEREVYSDITDPILISMLVDAGEKIKKTDNNIAKMEIIYPIVKKMHTEGYFDIINHNIDPEKGLQMDE